MLCMPLVFLKCQIYLLYFKQIYVFVWIPIYLIVDNIIDIIISFQIWIYFATLLKTTAPVKLTISHLFLKFCKLEGKH